MKLIGNIVQLFAHKEPAKPEMGEAAFANPYHLFGGKPFTEYNPSVLISRRGLTIIDDMRRDDQIKAAMSFKKHTVMAGGWDIVSPEGSKDRSNEEMVEKRLKEIQGGLENVILNVLTAMDYGYSITERVWVNEDGAKLSALKTRRPHEMEFVSDTFGNLTGLLQNSRELPIDKFIIYSYSSEFSNHYGCSDLEAAYRAWWTKDNAYKWMAMLLERMGIPPIFALYNTEDYKGATLTKLQTVLKRMQAATSGTIPRGDKDSLEMWSPELAGQVSTVFIPAMDMFNRDIARAILMPGLLGATPDAAEGSFARAQVHFDVFMLVIEHIRREIQELVQEQIVLPIVAVEIGPLDEVPRFEFRPLTDDVRLDLMAEWAKMVDADVVKRQAEDERHIRKQLKFPEREATDEEFEDKEPPPEAGGVDGNEDNQIVGKPDGAGGKAKARQLTAHAADKAAHFAQVAVRLDKIEAQAKDKLKNVLTVMRDQFVAGLPTKLTAIKIIGMELPDSPLEDSVAAMLLGAFGQGRKDIRAEVSPKPNAKPAATPKAALTYLRQKALWVKGVLEDQLLKDTKAVLLQSLHNGEGTADTTRKLLDVWLPYLGDETIIEDELQLTAPRLETIVRTNTTDAYNNGRLVEMRDPDLEGFIHGVEYSAIIDERTTEICQHLDRKIFRIGDSDLDRFTPPNHFNCRSILVPIMVDEPIDAADLITATDKGIALDLMDKGFGGAARFAWNESLHPRVPAGTDQGGQFGPGGGGSTRIDETLKERAIKAGRERGVEHASVINERGEVIIDKDGGEHYVDFSDQEINEMRGSIVLHNHPNQSSLSEGDLRMTNTAGLREIIAVTEDGGMYRGKALVNSRLLDNAFTASHGIVYNELAVAIGRSDGVFSMEMSNLVYGHAINSALAKAGAIAYDAQLGAAMKLSINLYDNHSRGFDELVNVTARNVKGVLP